MLSIDSNQRHETRIDGKMSASHLVSSGRPLRLRKDLYSLYTTFRVPNLQTNSTGSTATFTTTQLGPTQSLERSKQDRNEVLSGPNQLVALTPHCTRLQWMDSSNAPGSE